MNQGGEECDDWDNCEEDPMECNCPYGFEFCDDPQTRELGLCTTECAAYFRAVEEEHKEKGE